MMKKQTSLITRPCTALCRLVLLACVTTSSFSLLTPTAAGKDLKVAEAAGKRMKPNIIVIYTDDLGYGDVGCYGATKVKTPNIDRLAKQGRMFTDAHSPSAVCTPSRYGLLTGQFGWRKKIWGPLPYDKPLLISTEQKTLPGLLKQHGYATACVGKWHLGFGREGLTDWNKKLAPGPLELGFDYYYGIPLVNSHAPFVYVENHHVVGLDPEDPFVLRQPNPAKPPNTKLPRSPVQEFPEKDGEGRWSGATRAHELYRDRMVGTHLTEKSVAWLRQQAGKKEPFFLYFATPHIHHPFTPHPRFEGTSECGRYGDFIHELDWMVGEVLKTLDELKIADNTLVIFTSDNGGMLNQGGKDAWKAGHRLNGDLLGFKFGAWEGGHRVPFIARWPGRIEPGSRSDQLIGSIDLMASFAAMLGHRLKPQEAPDSVDVLEALTDKPEQPIREHLVLAPFWEKNLALRSGKWVYIGAQGSGGFGGNTGGPGALAWAGQQNSDVTSDGKIRGDAPKQQLYDLEADPSQAKNVIREHPKKAQELRQLLERLKQRSEPR
jgi:arylsulfatase A-like enzyme